MNSLGGVSSGVDKGYSFLAEENGLIYKKLPTELFELILSYLGEFDMQRASVVSKFWNKRAIDTAKQEEFFKIKSFTEFLDKNLDEGVCGSERKQLLSVDGRSKIFNSTTLMQVRSSICWIKENIINVLRDLSEEDLKKIEELSKKEPNPIYFENVFYLSKIYKKIVQASQISNDFKRGSALEKISEELMESGNIDKSIEVANAIPCDFRRGSALSSISQVLMKRGSVDKAIEVAHAVPYNSDRGSALRRISEELMQSDNFDKAIEVAHAISDYFLKEYTFKIIIDELMESDNFDKAIEVANAISDGSISGSSLREISRVLAGISSVDKAIEVANMIPNDVTRRRALQDIEKAKI